jgi:hypothetical protein
MRLTLRTLLAYMDEILESEDQQQLHEKIETSDYAGDLVHRTRDSMRRLRLSAPQVLGAGLGLDPNSVAEYLDNTFPVEHVADLERICLESDLHLAEVASCHQVLTMVLGQPADVDPDVRARMYAIPEHAEKCKQPQVEDPQTEQQAADPTVEQPAGDVPLSSQTDQPAPSEVPDYLRTSRRGPVEILAKVLAIAAILMAVGYFGLDWFGSPLADRQEVADGQATGGSTGIDAQPLANQSKVVDVDTDLNNQAVDQAGHSIPSNSLAVPPVEVGTRDSNSSLENTTGDDAPAASGAEAMPSVEGANSADNAIDFNGTELERRETAVTDSRETLGVQTTGTLPRSEQHNPSEIDSAPTTSLAAAAGRDRPDGVSVADLQIDGAVVAENGDDVAPVVDEPVANKSAANESAANESAANESAANESAELGTFWADRSMLLRLDPTQGAWVPLATGTSLSVDDELMALPTFRPTIALESGIGITLSGATLVKLDRSTLPLADQTKSIPLLEVVFGRVVLINSGEAGNALVLVVNNVEQTIKLGKDVRLAIEVRRRWVPGCDPEVTPAPIEATAYTADGGIDWADENGVTPIDVPARWNFVTGKPLETVSLDSAPFWLTEERSSRLERKAAEEIGEHLQPGMPAPTGLLELAGNRRKEVRALATQCGAYVGQFSPFVRALHDSDQRTVWPKYIGTLREAIALSPNSAIRLHQELVDQRGDEAATDLFEMLCGYRAEDIGRTPEEVKIGVLVKLIGWLESDNLDYRVLAAHNLNQITGKNLLQNPAAHPSDRTQGVRRWRQRLRQGELTIDESYRGH